MPDNNICSDLSARCASHADIGVWGDAGVCTAFAQSVNGGSEFLTVKEKDKTCNAHIFIADGSCDADNTEFYSATEGKPRVIVYADGSLQGVMQEAAKHFGCPAVNADWQNTGDGVNNVLRTLLFEFPLKRIDVEIPEWTQVMPQDNSAIAELLSLVTQCSAQISRMSGINLLDSMFDGAKYWNESIFVEADVKTGCVKIRAEAKDGIYYEMLSEIAGDGIDGEYSLMRFVRSAAEAKREYAKVKDALECASVNGYGIVQPSAEDIAYETPAVIRQGGNVGIKLKAGAPSYHIIRVDVSGEVNPIMGSAAQSENMVQGMMAGFERNAEEMWNTDLFGKTLKSMVQECLAAKVSCMQEDTRAKLRRAVTRMVNEGKGGAIVIIL